MREITNVAENLINSNFHSDRSNCKILTNITEFSIPARKVHFSLIIDCFDGMISWKVGTNPNAELVNSMLDEYHETIMNREKTIIHSDSGAHYRWPEWKNKDSKEVCPRKAVRQVTLHVKNIFG